MANADKLVHLRSGKLKYERISGYVFNRDHIKVALIVMVGRNTPIEKEDLACIEKFAEKMSSEIMNDNYLTAFGRAYHGTIINKLLDRVIAVENSNVYVPHVQILYDDFSDYLYLAVVGITQSNIRQSRLAYFKNLLPRR